jgi:cobalt-precorrin-7 (C5)-methyltransferase
MIVCIGIGPGDSSYLTQKAVNLLAEAEVVAGFDSVLNVVAPVVGKQAQLVPMSYRNQTEKLQDVAAEHHRGKSCVVAFMGDVHFSGFQLLERVERACGHSVETLPGISSAQILASRGKVCFDETTFITFHRRGDIEPFKLHLIHVLADGRNAIVIPHPWNFMPKDICRYLLDAGASGEHTTDVWENLTVQEATWTGRLSECRHDFSDMSIMLIRTLTPMGPEV